MPGNHLPRNYRKATGEQAEETRETHRVLTPRPPKKKHASASTIRMAPTPKGDVSDLAWNAVSSLAIPTTQKRNTHLLWLKERRGVALSARQRPAHPILRQYEQDVGEHDGPGSSIESYARVLLVSKINVRMPIWVDPLKGSLTVCRRLGAGNTAPGDVPTNIAKRGACLCHPHRLPSGRSAHGVGVFSLQWMYQVGFFLP